MVLLQEPGSEFQYQTSDVGHRTTDSGHQTSEIGHRTLDIRHQASDITHRTSNIGNQTSDIGHWTSDIRHRTSDIGHRTSDIGSMSDIWCQSPKSAVWCLMSDQWTLDIWNPYSSNFFFEKKKLGLLACYSLGFNFGPGIFWGFVGTFMGFYFPPFDCHPRQFSSGVSPWGVKAVRVQKLRVYSWTP